MFLIPQVLSRFERRNTMLVCKKISEVRDAIGMVRRRGERIGFVPTMGALHDGHMSLVRAARRECPFVAVSIFVNPTQFGPGEDFNRYPRPLEADLARCRQEGVGLVFNPEPEEMYPLEPLTTVQVAKLTEKLCGEFRPGHFTGVATVVTKLFNIVQPDVAFFGQKDAQQALVIRRMIRDLNQPVELRVCPTVREVSGLAMSSRNQYLSDQERRQAVCLYESLRLGQRLIRQGVVDTATITARMRELIESAGPCGIQYISIVDPGTVQEVGRVEGPVLIALAVKIGSTRLIDNILVNREGEELIISEL